VLFNPIVIDNVMYVQGTGNALVALDAATGTQLWSHPNQGAIGARGLNYWESAERSDRRLLYLNAGQLTAIDARTGELVQSFGANGRVDLRDALWRPARNPLQTSNPGRSLRGHRHHLAAGPGGRLRFDAGRRPGLRRADRQDPVGLPQHSASR
jgi:glucose dehydrogenase